MMEITFSQNFYDRDGDVWDECILIHCGDNTVLRFGDMNDLSKFIEGVKKCRDEIAG